VTDEGNGLRARKKRATARRIETVALGLFESDGFDATTVEAIASAADIAPRTFFHYFPTKEDVVLADYEDRLVRVVETLEAQPPDVPAWSALAAAFRAVAADYETARDDLIRRFRVMATTGSVFARSLQLQAGWEDAVADVLTRRMEKRPGQPDPRLLAAAGVAAMRSALSRWLSADAAESLPDLVQNCFRALGQGLDQPP